MRKSRADFADPALGQVDRLRMESINFRRYIFVALFMFTLWAAVRWNLSRDMTALLETVDGLDARPSLSFEGPLGSAARDSRPQKEGPAQSTLQRASGGEARKVEGESADRLLPISSQELAQKFKDKLGLSMKMPSAKSFEFATYMNGQLLVGAMKLNDEVTVEVYGYEGAATEQQIVELMLSETNSELDDWEQGEPFGKLVSRGFSEERIFEHHIDSEDYSNYLIYARGPRNRHFIFSVWGDGPTIDKDLKRIRSIYDSLELR